jgi:3-oxoacyl-[acyl-carrier-protein] synthase-3
MIAKSIVKGVGSFLPTRIITNEELAKQVDTSDEWIQKSVGIKQRHVISEGESTSYLAHQAALRALEAAKVTPDAVDMIILGTTTPDNPFPATATRVQKMLGAGNAFAFDIQAVCSGFVYALSIADNFIRAGQVKTALVICAESMSQLVDWSDRSTCVLFGDGAGAVVLQGGDAQGERGILSTHLHSDGTLYDALYVDNSMPTPHNRGHIKMSGRTIFIQAVRRIGESIERALTHNNLRIEDIDWFVPHQANKRIIDGVAEHFGLPPEKTIVTIAEHANTSAASIPLALHKAVHEGKIKEGQLVLVEAMGGGLTWGSALIRW